MKIRQWEIVPQAGVNTISGNITNLLDAGLVGEDLVVWGVWDERAAELEVKVVAARTEEDLDGLSGQYFRSIKDFEGRVWHLFVVIPEPEKTENQTIQED